MAPQKAFGVPYSVCGCVPDRDRESGIFFQLASMFRSSKGQPVLVINSRPDLLSMEDEDADASHPSEHNVDFGDPNSEVARSALSTREAKAYGRLYKASRCTSPKRDPWVNLQAERKLQRDGHKEAFTDPMLGAAAYYPYWGITMFPTYG